MNFINKIIYSPFTYFLLVIIVFRIWFLGNSILSYSDWLFLYPESFPKIYNIYSSWIFGGMGGVNLFSYFSPVLHIMSLLNSLSLNFGQIERIVFMIPFVVFSYWGMYFLSKRLFESKMGSIISAILYTINTYVLVISSGHLTILVAYSLIPLILFFYLRANENKNVIVNSLLCGVFLSVSSLYEFRIFYITAAILFLHFIFITIINFDLNDLIKRSFKFIYILYLPIALNFYWLFGLSKNGSIGSNIYFDRELFGNHLLNINYAFNWYHPFWNGSNIIDFTTQKISALSLLFPIIAFFSLYLGRKNKHVLFFGSLSLLGVFLTKQSSRPFQDFYHFLFTNFPGFSAFREASKFYILISLGYSVLIGFFISRIKSFRGKNHQKFAIVFVFLILFNVASFSLPLATGKIGTLFKERSVPYEYLALNKLLKNDSDNKYTILWVPRKSRWSYYDENIRLLSFDEILLSQWSIYMEESSKSGSLSTSMLNFFDIKLANEILNQSNVKYIIVPLIDEKNDDNFFKYYVNRNKFTEKLDTLTYLKRLDFQSEEITIYENADFLPLIHLSDKKGDDNISFEYVRPDLINLHLEVESNEIEIIFSNSFNSLWSLIGSTNITENNILTNSYQSKFGYNKFIINVSETCRKIKCEKNENKTSLKLFLKFNLQENFDKGLKLTLFFVTIYSFVSLFLVLKEKSENKS